jgi:hypothetical protein
VRRIAIYSDYVLTFTAFQTQRTARSDIIVDLPKSEWDEYQRIEKQYAEWQEKLEKIHNRAKEEGIKVHGKRVAAKAKAG